MINENEGSKGEFFVSRIDRSVADNLNDIRTSFGDDAGVVKDFIVFVSKNMKRDLFGYTKFTLQDFCKETGRNRQDLAKRHPYFVSNPKAVVPEYHGHQFVSVFDYSLFLMLQRNIIFAKTYTVNTKDEVIQLENFPILKDIKLNMDRASNTVKIYEIRISDQWMDGFISRYYTVETNGYRMIGKGRGGDGRKSLYLILQRTRHQCLSQNQTIARFSVDYLAHLAEVDVEENRFRKRAVKRMLDLFLQKDAMPFSYRFVKADRAKVNQEEYWVEINFAPSSQTPPVAEEHGDHVFFNSLVRDLKKRFKLMYSDVVIEDEKDHFQRWLTNHKVDLDVKVDVLIAAYNKAYSAQMTKIQAKQYIRQGGLIS
ncbi:MAG: hypothetical protein BGO21_26085 [Dyadobacter sp. 50-39]|uniref:hypothetical protein n=1 Tax=Dyadobacter sp. 50-39 TaxID=1895756 RepID=UPI0009626084|nr:hypothetical protein [Dyadobacter sp. 50-39]OJV17354.1 MAG: hypothetical protein BGO21_26085 [Dyadobacter sp. 50-39]